MNLKKNNKTNNNQGKKFINTVNKYNIKIKREILFSTHLLYYISL